MAKLKIPHSLPSERAVLGACLADETAFSRAVSLLRSDDFYSDQHREIWEACLSLYRRGKPIDLVTLCDATAGKCPVSYISGLADELPDVANIEHYAKIVRDKSVQRDILNLGNELIMAAGSDQGGDTALDMVQNGALKIAERTLGESLRPLGDILGGEIKRLENEVTHGRQSMEYGYTSLDGLLHGFCRQDLVVIAADPGIGKTAFAINLAVTLARRGVKVAIFSVEMSAGSLARRILAFQMSIENWKLQKGLVVKEDLPRVALESDKLSDLPIWIDASPTITPAMMRARAKLLKMRGGLDVVIVDYLQLVDAGIHKENRTQEVSYVSSQLKAIAKDLDVTVFAASQLRRRESAKAPELDDLRESGRIGQDCDTAIFFTSEQIESTDSKLVKVYVRKNRNGPIGEAKLIYIPKLTLFQSYSNFVGG